MANIEQKIDELNDKLCDLTNKKRDIEVEIVKTQHEIESIESLSFNNLKTLAREKLKGHYAIIPFSGGAFSLYYVKDISEETRYGKSYVDIIGADCLFRKLSKNFEGIDLLYNPERIHGISKSELDISLVLDDNIAEQFVDFIKKALDKDKEGGLIRAYKNIYDYYKHEIGKTIEEATKESLDNFYKEVNKK